MRSDQAAELKRCLDEAFRAFEAGDDATARRLCREALAIDPESSTAHSLMGLLYEREGRLSDATGEFETVLEQNPRSRAERSTLHRLRAEEESAAPEDEPAAPARPWLTYVLPAAAAALVLLATIFVVHALAHRGETQVAAADVTADLAAAREAFNRGDYRAAAAAAQRVLAVEPNNTVARDIYDRAMAFLRAGQPPSSGPAAGFGNPSFAQSPPAQVESVPAYGPQAAAGAAGQTGQTGQAGQGGGGRGPLQPQYTPNVNLPDVPIPPAGYGPGQPYYSGRSGPTRPVRPPVAGTVSNLPGAPVREPRQPLTVQVSPDAIAPPDDYRPAGSQPPAPHPDSDNGRIRVTVDPPQPRRSTDPAPEVSPDLGSPSQALPPADNGRSEPEDPAVRRFREEQERLRQARERQRNAQRRRLETP